LAKDALTIKKMRILLTGGTGYLGRAVARALATRGHDVVVFARTASRSGVVGTPFDGDVRDRDALMTAAEGCEVVVHSAALVSIWRRRPRDFDDVNVGGLRNVIAAATAARVRRIVYTSSFLALPPRGRRVPLELNDYQRTKVAADRVAGEASLAGAPIVRLYPGVIYGPGAATEGNLLGKLIADHLKHRLPGLVGADNPWSFAYVDDVAAAHCEVAERSALREQYVLGGPNEPPRQAFTLVAELTGRRPPMRLPFPLAMAIGAAEEWRVTRFGGTPLVTRGAVNIFRYDWSLDSRDAVDDLGYTITPLRHGIAETIQSL
jgi:NAD+-dependent farnesol dehydrogenase